MEFVEGQEVEVTDEELRDSWYSAKVMEKMSCQGEKKKILVEYEKLVAGEMSPCKDCVDVELVRPRPPPSPLNHSFRENQLVDAFHANRWWKGTITKVLGGFRCEILINPSIMNDMKLEFGFEKLRVHQDWVDGKWVIPENQPQPQSQEIQQQSIEEINNQNDNVVKKRRGSEEASGVKKRGTRTFPALRSDLVGCTQLRSCTTEEQQSPSLEKLDTLIFVGHENETSNNNQTLHSCLGKNDLLIKEGTESEITSSESLSSNMEDNNTSGDQSMKTSSPFIKTSNLWEGIESMEIFKLLPQHPHFLPLENKGELLHEGCALGYTLSFATIWEKTCKASLDDPKPMFESKINALSVLEKLGFNVDPIRSRLKELLKMRDSFTQLSESSKAADMEVDEKTCEFDQIHESIAELFKKLQSLVAEQETKGLELAELRRKADGIREGIRGVRVDFSSLIAAPLK